MKNIILFSLIFILALTSCKQEAKQKPFMKNRKNSNDSTLVEKPKKKGRPKMIPETEFLEMKKEIDSLRLVLSSGKATYVRKKNNYVCQFPELSKVLLLQMRSAELKRIPVPDEYLTQQFYDFYEVEYTDKRILEYLDDRINEFIVYTSNNSRVNFNAKDSENIIIKSKK